MNLRRAGWFALTAALCLAAAAPWTSAADDPEPATPSAQEDEAGKNVTRLTLAYDLAEYGLQEKSPEALIAAARILRKMPRLAVLGADAQPTSTDDSGK